MFAALADRTRRDIVARLSRGEATVKELAAPYAMSLQAVSQHIGVLERCGLVSRGRHRQTRPCRRSEERRVGKECRRWWAAACSKYKHCNGRSIILHAYRTQS